MIEMDKFKSNTLFVIADEMLRLQSSFETMFCDMESLANLSRLSTLQKLVLSCVLDAPVPPTVPQIGRNLGHPRQVIQRIANELVHEGLIEKVSNPHHQRASLLVATPAALELSALAEERTLQMAEALLDKMNAERSHTLISELRALREAIEALTATENVVERPHTRSSITGALALL